MSAVGGAVGRINAGIPRRPSTTGTTWPALDAFQHQHPLQRDREVPYLPPCWRISQLGDGFVTRRELLFL